MLENKPTIPENTSEKDERVIRASCTTNQQNLWLYMTLKIFHEAKITTALVEAYFVCIQMGNLGLG